MGLYDWLVTWPPRTIPNGFVIPDWLRRDDRMTPPDVFAAAGLTPYAYSMEGVRTLAEFDANARREVSEKPGRFVSLARVRDLDVGAVTFYSADATGHRFWRAAFPSEFSEPRTKDEATFEHTIRDTYRGIDAALGQVVASLAPDDSIVVVSDHGFEADPKPRRIWSLRVFEGPDTLGLDPARDGFEVDGEFMALVIRVLPGPAGKREETIAKLVSALSGVRTEAGEAVLEVDVLPVAERPEEARGGLWQRLRAFVIRLALRFLFGVELDRPAYAYVLARPVDAALLPLWPDGSLRSGDRRYPVSALFQVDAFTGRHDPTALFLAAGGPIAPLPERGRVSVLEVAPLLFHLAGSPVPDDLERPVPTRFLDPKALSARPVRTVPAAELPGLPPERDTSDVDDAVLLERLRALGYVE